MGKTNLELRGRIVQKYGSQGLFAKHLGKTEQTITSKLNGRSKFTREDILEWCNALCIDTDDVGKYFFSQELSND